MFAEDQRTAHAASRLSPCLSALSENNTPFWRIPTGAQDVANRDSVARIVPEIA